MYERFNDVTLKSGEIVQAGVVICPDAEWAERIEGFLQHKGEPWNWQNSEVVRKDIGLEGYFYILHRDGKPFSGIMTVEKAGVGIFGHVFTKPEDRRKGACSFLMKEQMAHFNSRGGKALFLGTGFDSAPYHIYKRDGFIGIADKSGYMDYYATSKKDFERWYFGAGETEIRPVEWQDWGASPALFLGDFPGVVRCAPMKLIGRNSTEGPFIPMIRGELQRREKGEASHAMVLCNAETTAVCGLAMWDWHPLWPGSCLVDVYCHPNHWDKAGELLSSLTLPKADRVIAYADTTCGEKSEVLKFAGFQQTATLKDRVAIDPAKTDFADVLTFEKL